VQEGKLTQGHRGTIHAWKNVSKENCKVLFVLIPAEPVKVKKTGENLRETANTGELHDE
jgi:quercetin dioxygenase-like cupin family protein